MTRRALVAALAAAAVTATAKQIHKTWRPRLGVLGRFSAANVTWAAQTGFTNMILGAGTDETSAPELRANQLDSVHRTLAQHKMNVSALQCTVNHIHPDPAIRRTINDWFAGAIEKAGRLNVAYIGTASGKNPSLPFTKQVDEIVRVYHERYFPLCERHHVRILWEPWPDGPNLAISPVGFETLLRAFDNSPYVGLQYDPSHLVRQFMDPIQTARDFVDHIYDVHLKDTEILWPVLRANGIHPVNKAAWWRYRIPGMGSIDWRDFFSVLQNAGYQGAMSIEQEDPLYGGDDYDTLDFPENFKLGFVMAKKYLDQYVPAFSAS